MLYGICSYALQSHYALLLEDRGFTKNSRTLETGTWLPGGSWWKVIKALWLYDIVQVSLFLLSGGAMIGNVQLPGLVRRACIWLFRQSNYRMKAIQLLWKLVEISRKVCIFIWLNRIAENQTFLRNSFFSNTYIHRFLYWLIEWLYVNHMLVISF